MKLESRIEICGRKTNLRWERAANWSWRLEMQIQEAEGVRQPK